MAESATPHELETFADLVDGGIGEACKDHENRAGFYRQSELDYRLVADVIEAIGEARRRGIRIGEAIAERLNDKEEARHGDT